MKSAENQLAEKNTSIKILSDNRQAGHNYFLMDRYEAGMVLTGTEVKAAKDGKIQLKDAYASVFNNEAWLVNAHISQYSHGNRENHPPVGTANCSSTAAKSKSCTSTSGKRGWPSSRPKFT